MGITTKTHKMLWGKSGNRCAMPNCQVELVMDFTETDDESLIGEECHIVARKFNGPRGDENFDIDKLDLYGNLVLMCRNHHKIIDDKSNLSFYTIEKLKEIKSKHENWVQSQLTTEDKEKLKTDLVYTTYIDKWIELSDLNNWKNWTSWLMSADSPSVPTYMYENLEELKIYLFSRIWPKEYIELENAFINFMKILEDLLNQFHKHAKESGEMYYTEGFHKLEWHEEETYQYLFRQYMFHFYSIQDLTVELTRSANHICTLIRKYIDNKFRLEEGLIFFESGPFMDLENGMIFKKVKVEYSNEDKRNGYYNSFEKFKEERENRDYYISVGISAEDKKFIDFLNSY